MSSIKVRKYQDSVYIIYCHKNKKFKIFTGVKIEDKFWNLCAPKKNCPGYANVINQIAMIYKVLEYYCTWREYRFDIDTWDVAAFGRFVQYLHQHRQMADSIIHRHVKWLRSFLKHAYQDRNFMWMKYAVMQIDEEYSRK